MTIPSLAETDEIYNVLDQELKREFTSLHSADSALYFMDFRVESIHVHYINTSFGYVTNSNDISNLYATITMRYGDKEFDNTHLIKGERQKSFTKVVLLPNGSPEGIKQLLWRNVSDLYEQVKSDYSQLKNKIKASEDKEQDDFSSEDVNNYYEPEETIVFSESDKNKWKKQLTKCSAVFTSDDAIISGNVNMSFVLKREYYLNSEGTRVTQNNKNVSLYFSGKIKSEDGNDTPYLKKFVAQTPDHLPSDTVLLKTSEEVKDMLLKLKAAPLADPYAGPVIMSPAAAGVFFHEIFGHRLEGFRLKDTNNGNTFKDKLNKSVLPKTFNIYFDPTQEFYNNTYLNGYYLYDDEGVKAHHVDVVQNGILKTFLMNRTPIPGISQSNAHGRASISRSTVSRQSNMFISSTKPLSDEKLRNMLIKECKKQKKEYGYYVNSVTGGYTNTMVFRPSAFNVTPTEVYRVYVDGRPDELVRGVNFIGTPLAIFSEIAAAGDKPAIFNGYCGAESGQVPVATISPAVFITKVETQKKHLKYDQPVILTAPHSLNDK